MCPESDGYIRGTGFLSVQVLRRETCEPSGDVHSALEQDIYEVGTILLDACRMQYPIIRCETV